jgi:hypothetical protein
MGIKCCPNCGSTNVNFLVFYRPSTWRCLDCGYEGAFIIEDGNFTEQLLGHIRGRCDMIDWVKGEPRMDNWDGLGANWSKV